VVPFTEQTKDSTSSALLTVRTNPKSIDLFFSVLSSNFQNQTIEFALSSVSFVVLYISVSRDHDVAACM